VISYEYIIYLVHPMVIFSFGVSTWNCIWSQTHRSKPQRTINSWWLLAVDWLPPAWVELPEEQGRLPRILSNANGHYVC